MTEADSRISVEPAFFRITTRFSGRLKRAGIYKKLTEYTVGTCYNRNGKRKKE